MNFAYTKNWELMQITNTEKEKSVQVRMYAQRK